MPAADVVLRSAFHYTRSFLPALAIAREIEPAGLLAAVAGGEIVGTVGAVTYEQLAYLGFMSVAPHRQREGIARLLMERLLAWLEHRGVRTVLLDATDKGAPLYESLGFVDDAAAYVYERLPNESLSADQNIAPVGAATAALSVRRAQEQDLAAIVAVDAAAFGANRHKLLAVHFREQRAQCLVACDAAGNLVGYLFARDPMLGPWVANTAAAAECLLRAALTSPLAPPEERLPLVMVPRSNARACELLSRHGFAEQRRLRHMRLGGTSAPGLAERLFGQSSFAHG